MDGLYGKPDALNFERLVDDITWMRNELLIWWLNDVPQGSIEDQAESLCQLLTQADGFDVPIVEGLYPLLENRIYTQGNRVDKTLEGRYYILTVILLGPPDPDFLEVVQEMRKTWDGYPSPRGTGDY